MTTSEHAIARRTSRDASWAWAALLLAFGCSSQAAAPGQTTNGFPGANGQPGQSAAPVGSGSGGASGGPIASGSGGSTQVSGAGGMTASAGGAAPAGPSTGAGGAADGTGAGGATTTGQGGTGAAGAPATCDKDLTAKPGQDECTAPLKPGDDRLCKMMSGGAQRQFYIYATPSFDPCKPASMIMDCHGLSETAEVQAGKAGFNLSGSGMYPSGYGSSWRMAVQKDNAIVVTPQGVGDSWTPSTDVAFLNQAADTVEMIANVDPERVYVTGISMGGMMTVATGCDNSKRWRGMSPVAMLSQSCAKLDRPTPVISFHSMTDMLTSYSDDSTLMQTIAGFNHCKSGPTDLVQYGGAMTSTDPVCFTTANGIGAPDAPNPYAIPLQPCSSSAPVSKCQTWTQCDEGVEVVFCTVAASTQPLGGHILYNNDTQLDLSEVAWPFFKKFWK